jgi:NitT/TauT family transport system ATP-binding protein
MRLIIHATTVAAYRRARRNLANLLADEPEALVELVANAAAVKEAIDTIDAEIRPHLVLCGNSLRAAGLACPAGVRTTAAAVHHIARRQSEGWGYFRA